ncbi:MAG: methyltransferase domain-containing protein [Candidatus Eremiobacteraeota bacterium]|nr:methyltransferase domain-containing protein [Candidatus Eremiobacteraeota bacterium]MCW5870368.1 methyltransferase domain-containing protein [Candidatus Eremiobacteraeota bacterium]
MDWKPQAVTLSQRVTHPTSRWRGAVALVPRHLLVPRWFAAEGEKWKAVDGSSDPVRWLKQAYRDATIITRVGPVHADGAEEASGRPTSSSTLPTLVLMMLRHLRVFEGARVLDVGTGPGYAAALLSHRLGGNCVTSIDVDPYLVEVARERLGGLDLRPTLKVCDATGPLPGQYDRIVATVSVRPVPPSWLTALKPGGVLVTTLAGTSLIVTATKQEDGTAVGQVVSDGAGFMSTRTGLDYPPAVELPFHDEEGEEVYQGRFPVPDIENSWGLACMLEVTLPGVKHRFKDSPEGQRTTWLTHPDGSWARASSHGCEPPTVHEAGPRKLWGVYETICCDWFVRGGGYPLVNSSLKITPDGVCHLSNWGWPGATIG